MKPANQVTFSALSFLSADNTVTFTIYMHRTVNRLSAFCCKCVSQGRAERCRDIENAGTQAMRSAAFLHVGQGGTADQVQAVLAAALGFKHGLVRFLKQVFRGGGIGGEGGQATADGQ